MFNRYEMAGCGFQRVMTYVGADADLLDSLLDPEENLSTVRGHVLPCPAVDCSSSRLLYY